MKPPTEIKVPQAAAGGAGLSAISQLVIWVLGCWVWGASWDADKVTDAWAAVPSPVTVVIGIAFTYAGAYFFGYRAPHTPRPDLDPRPIEPIQARAAAPQENRNPALLDQPSPRRPTEEAHTDVLPRVGYARVAGVRRRARRRPHWVDDPDHGISIIMDDPAS